MRSLVLKELSYLGRQKDTGVTYQCDLTEERGMTGILTEQRQGGLKTGCIREMEWVKVNVILLGSVWWEPRRGRFEKGESFGLTYEEGFIKYLLLEQLKCEFLQFLCLDLFQPNGLEHLGGLKAMLRAGVRSHEG